MPSLIFARHGESQANVEHVIANRGSGYPLTVAGWAQAHVLANRLVGLEIDRVFSSPLLRAQQTAGVVAERTGAPVTLSTALSECDMGEWEGSSDPAAWEVHRTVVDAWATGDLQARSPGGESLAEMVDRLRGFLDQCAESPEHGSVAAIGHGSLFGAALPLLLGGLQVWVAAAHPLGYTDLVLAEPDGPGFRCVGWAGRRQG